MPPRMPKVSPQTKHKNLSSMRLNPAMMPRRDTWQHSKCPFHASHSSVPWRRYRPRPPHLQILLGLQAGGQGDVVADLRPVRLQRAQHTCAEFLVQA